MVSTKQNTTVASISEIWNYIVGAQKVTWNDISQHNQNSYKVEYIVLSLNSEAHCFAGKKKQKTSPYWYLLSNKNPPKKLSIQKQHENCHYKSVHLADGWILKICFFHLYSSIHAKWIPDCLWQQTYFDIWMNTRFVWQHIISKHHEGPWLGSVELILFKECLQKVFLCNPFLGASSWTTKLVQKKYTSFSIANLVMSRFGDATNPLFCKCSKFWTVETNKPPLPPSVGNRPRSGALRQEGTRPNLPIQLGSSFRMRRIGHKRFGRTLLPCLH